MGAHGWGQCDLFAFDHISAFIVKATDKCSQVFQVDGTVFHDAECWRSAAAGSSRLPCVVRTFYFLLHDGSHFTLTGSGIAEEW